MHPPSANHTTPITFHSPCEATVESCAGDTRQRGQGFAKVVRGAFSIAVNLFIAAMLALWLAGAIYRKSEDLRMEREAQRMAEEYNRSIKEMESIAVKLREANREIRH